MSPEIIGLIGIIALLFLMYTRMWIGFVLLFVGFWGIVAITGWDIALSVIATVPFRNVANYNFAAMSLFLLMGMIIYNAGFASDMFYTANKWLGQLRGGLAIATSMACAILGVVTDSLVAVITMGKVAIPEMRKYQYDDSLSTASVVAGGSLASLVPPSVGFIIFAILTGESVGELYMAAVVPSIILTLMIVMLIVVQVRINPKLAPAGPKTSLKEKLLSLKYTWGVLCIILLILGGIYAGVFTPTEAGAIGAFGSMVIGVVSRRLNKQALLGAILETAQMTAMIVLLMVGAFTFINLMTLSQLPFTMAEFIVGIDVNKYVILTFVILVYIIFGMFSDIMAAILITVPIVYPLMVSMGFDPVWYAVLLVILVEVAMITPPIGMSVFYLSGIVKVPINVIFRGVWPFVGAILLFVVIMTVFPEIVLWLPGTM